MCAAHATWALKDKYSKTTVRTGTEVVHPRSTGELSRTPHAHTCLASQPVPKSPDYTSGPFPHIQLYCGPRASVIHTCLASQPLNCAALLYAALSGMTRSRGSMSPSPRSATARVDWNRPRLGACVLAAGVSVCYGTSRGRGSMSPFSRSPTARVERYRPRLEACVLAA